jgi:beta-lactamase regulating signal transducer with metallopeptidase domain
VVTFVALRNSDTSERGAIAASTSWHAPIKSSLAVRPAESAPTAPFNLPPNVFGWLVEAWFTGVILFSARTLGGVLVIEKLRRRASAPVSEKILAACVALQKRMGIERVVQYRRCMRVDAPAVIGWIRPVVLLPVSALTGLDEDQLLAVIAHELAHVKRHDAFVNLFQIAAETLLFYHPAIWWMSARIRAEREHCCDDAAIELCGNAVAYARALALLEERRGTPVMVMAANGSPLGSRIRRLLGVAELRGGIRRVGLAAGILCLSAAVLAGNTLFGFVRGASAAQIQAQPQSQSLPAGETSASPAKNSQPAMVVWAKRPTRETDASAEQSQEQDQSPRMSASKSFIDEMKAVGFDNLSADELIALKVQGVTPDYIREIHAEGLKPDADDLIAMKVQGISPQYIGEMRATGLKLDSADDLVAMKVQGVTPEYIREMRATGLKLDNADDVVAMKVRGVSPEYVKQIRQLGLESDSDSVIAMKVQGVTPEFVQSMRALELKIDGDDIVSMKVQGVTPEYVRSIQSLGFKPDSDEIVGMKVQGVTADYVKSLQASGLKMDIDDIISAKVQGITPEFIARAKSHGFKDLTLEKLIELRQAGILD